LWLLKDATRKEEEEERDENKKIKLLTPIIVPLS